jgi:hypothetical protein
MQKSHDLAVAKLTASIKKKDASIALRDKKINELKEQILKLESARWQKKEARRVSAKNAWLAKREKAVEMRISQVAEKYQFPG